MNTTSKIILAGILCILTITSLSLAQVPTNRTPATPGIINYQGRLLTPAGGVYSDGVYTVEFRLYETDTGVSSGLWACAWAVYVKDGYFNVMLGAPGASAATNPPTYGPTELWRALWYDPNNPSKANDRYLGIKVTAGPDSSLPSPPVEAFPRQRFLSAPFAERAQMAEYARAAVDTFTVGTSLTVTGMTTAVGGLTVQNAATLQATTVNGAMTLNQGVTVNTQQGAFNKGVTVDGGVTTVKAGLDVTGAATFRGGVNAAAGKVQEGGNDLIPHGVIVMWSGSTAPAGWALCDGNNGTPNLRGRFIVGYDPADGDYNAIAKTGGEKWHTLSIWEMPSHAHTYFGGFVPESGDWHGGGSYSWNDRTGYTATYDTDSRGGDQPHENRPPYYVLAYIMKM